MLTIADDLRRAGLPPIQESYFSTREGIPEIHLKFRLPFRDGEELSLAGIRLRRLPYAGHKSLNALLVFDGLLEELAAYKVTSASRVGDGDRTIALRVKFPGQHAGLETPVADGQLSEEVTHPEGLFEGAVRTVVVNAYERDPEARRRCIAAHGTSCAACGMSLGAEYGSVAEGFIHVHHLRPLSEVRAAHQVDPVADLRPVCPNCHAVVHRRVPPYSIEEVRAFWLQRHTEASSVVSPNDALQRAQPQNRLGR